MCPRAPEIKYRQLPPDLAGESAPSTSLRGLTIPRETAHDLPPYRRRRQALVPVPRQDELRLGIESGLFPGYLRLPHRRHQRRRLHEPPATERAFTPSRTWKSTPTRRPVSSWYKDTVIYASPGPLASGWPKMTSSEASSTSTSLQLGSDIGSRGRLRTVRESPLHIGFGQWRKLDGRWTGKRKCRIPMTERSVPS